MPVEDSESTLLPVATSMASADEFLINSAAIGDTARISRDNANRSIGLPDIQRVTSGSSLTLATLTAIRTTVIWRSASGAAKTLNIPGANGYDGYELEVKDAQGDARTNNITVTPAAGTVESDSSLILRANRGCLVLRADGANNDWVLV